ncbi:MAG: TylF/MycF/NovP-related O-methyltransferase [Alphaproteobacteria bacterium]
MRLLTNIRLEAAKARGRLRRALAQGLGEEAPMDFGAFTTDLVAEVAPYTLTPPERIHNLELAIRYLVRCSVPGDVVECGVWRGGSMMAAARVLMDEGDRERRLVLYDTFEGMTEPGPEDLSASGKPALRSYKKRLRRGQGGWARAGLDEVKANLIGTGYPPQRLRFVKGPVEQTLPDEAAGAIALLRLDTDWYQSTRVELEHLFPRLSKGGVLMIDDYGRWMGQRQAVDEYLEAHQVPILLTRIDAYSRMGVKQ